MLNELPLTVGCVETHLAVFSNCNKKRNFSLLDFLALRLIMLSLLQCVAAQSAPDAPKRSPELLLPDPQQLRQEVEQTWRARKIMPLIAKLKRILNSSKFKKKMKKHTFEGKCKIMQLPTFAKAVFSNQVTKTDNLLWDLFIDELAKLNRNSLPKKTYKFRVRHTKISGLIQTFYLILKWQPLNPATSKPRPFI
jgi:hypothetical protein